MRIWSYVGIIWWGIILVGVVVNLAYPKMDLSLVTLGIFSFATVLAMIHAVKKALKRN